jgi:hypothetical protein
MLTKLRNGSWKWLATRSPESFDQKLKEGFGEKGPKLLGEKIHISRPETGPVIKKVGLVEKNLIGKRKRNTLLRMPDTRLPRPNLHLKNNLTG